jgi:uncharacterized membrane protein YcaP (DUF421 family)
MQLWYQILIKSILFFFLSILITRVIGKRSIARLSTWKFVIYVVIAILVALTSVGVISLTFGLISLGVWALFPVALDYLCVKSKWIHDVVNGKETVLMKHGKIMEENLMKERLTGEELLRELRAKNAFCLADVEFALMETTGELNVFMKSDRKPVTAHDMGIKISPQAEPQTIIMDGSIIDESLSSLGLNHEWLGIQLENCGVSLDNVFLGQVDSSGDLYLDLFDDAVELPQSKVKEMLYANLEKVQADLLSFSLETNDANTKTMYEQNAGKLQQVIDKLKPFLLK